MATGQRGSRLRMVSENIRKLVNSHPVNIPEIVSRRNHVLPLCFEEGSRPRPRLELEPTVHLLQSCDKSDMMETASARLASWLSQCQLK